ncbi:MAG TPA: neutral zinc metallopeptidase [Flavipsychrobacter sp.]|nr:neutral zinc metallopeptidase [Flavipsychrobacter sp.]
MKWIGRRQSDNVEDGRGMGGGTIIGGGLGALVLGLIVYFLGGDPSQILNQGGGSATASHERTAAEDSAAAFVGVVLADTEDVWNKLFQQNGQQYEEPKLHLFTGSVNSGCGGASAASGPFYCPMDRKVYIDLSFYDELKNRFNSPGDFAMAYVVAHEVGHHIQNLLGISEKVQAARQRVSEEEGNALSVRLELQADFLAGVWAHHAQRMKDILESGDIEEALNAAHAIGDDNLQKEARGYIVPESFTHGTSQQRMYWFKKGFDTGDMNQGDTFAKDAI